MKHILNYTVLILTLAIFMIPSEGKSQCSYECSNSWNPVELIGDYNGCSYIIHYRWRECGDPVKREMKIDQIRFFDHVDCNYSGDEKEMMEVAMREVLNYSHKIFPSLPDGNNDIHIYTECCWKYDTQSLGDENYWAPCPPFDECCCKNLVTVDRVVNPDDSEHYELGSKVVISDDTGYSCGGPTGDPDCEKVCDVIDSLEVGENLALEDYHCTDQCETEWTTPTNSPSSGSGPCNLIAVPYETRECEDTVQIRFGSFLYNDDGNCDEDVDGKDIDDLIKKAIRNLLRNEATNYNLPKYFQVNLPTCFRTATYGSYDVAEVCAWEDNCCLVTYKIRAGAGIYIQGDHDYNLDTLNGFVSCGTLIDCEFVCDDEYVELPYNTSLKKSELQINENLFDTKTNVYPNPADKRIQFDIETFLTVDLVLEIYDHTGKKLNSIELNNNNGFAKYEYDISNLAKGLYLFKVNAGLHTVDVGKFIVK